MKYRPHDVVSARLENAKDSEGQPGIILGLRAWKDHQASDNLAELHDRALKSQEEALRKQEADMVRVVQAMSMNPAEPGLNL